MPFGAVRAPAADPSTIIYATQPSAYFDDHAAEVKKFTDGFFFVIGDWSTVARRFAGAEGKAPEDQRWLEGALKNLVALRKAGVTERIPVEDQDHERPPKRVVEEMFRQRGKRYIETLHPRLVPGAADYREFLSGLAAC